MPQPSLLRKCQFSQETRNDLADITEEKFLDVLAQTVKARDGISPAAPKTLNHWIDAGKELFKWFYTRENKRRAREGFPPLDNPLELLAKKKIRRKDEPATITVSDARALLCDLLEHAPRALFSTDKTRRKTNSLK